MINVDLRLDSSRVANTLIDVDDRLSLPSGVHRWGVASTTLDPTCHSGGALFCCGCGPHTPTPLCVSLVGQTCYPFGGLINLASPHLTSLQIVPALVRCANIKLVPRILMRHGGGYLGGIHAIYSTVCNCIGRRSGWRACVVLLRGRCLSCRLVRVPC